MDFSFLLKKFVSFFVEPFGLVLSILVIGLYFLFVKRYVYAKYVLSFGIALMLLFSYPLFSNYLVSSLEDRYEKYDYSADIKYIHVLGSGHNTDEKQPISSQISQAGIKRVVEGVIIHKRVEGSKLIFTGYAGKTSIATAKMAKNVALALGVNESDIIVSVKPKDTKEEALFAKSIVKDEKFVLVTSATHMPRSMQLFKSLSLNAIAAPTNFYRDNDEDYLRAPGVSTFYISQIAVHEYLGILWNKIRG